ncbi:hypothetical protein Cci01nite_27410 [Catellatospora citrea]|uniref:Uncharacterized protein n=1 Tax=Catellatospora citrea TaxID=53366 RepID=A0A8J3NYU7_9ACTN|nr:hypothetical protein Cci01nite_27410 [Catellatospora citrea]
MAAVVVAALIGVGIGLQIGGPSATDEAVASLREQEAQRDVAQVAELTARARQTVAVLNPIVDGLADLGTAAVPTAEQVQGWQKSLAEEVRWYSVTVSGMTATNVARATLRSAVEQLSVAVDTVALARASATGQRDELLALAGRQRGLAVAAWSVAATHLDQINVDAGNGHQHVYLQAGHEDGAMTGDGLPEGTKH